jgi:hypothetical protein
VRDFGCSRGELNREHLVTVLAPKETDILHLPDGGDAPGLTERTPGRWLQEKAEASLAGGLGHLPPNPSSLPDGDARRLEFEFQLLKRLA